LKLLILRSQSAVTGAQQVVPQCFTAMSFWCAFGALAVSGCLPLLSHPHLLCLCYWCFRRWQHTAHA